MIERKAKLKLHATGAWVDAKSHEDLGLPDLNAAEAAWKPERDRISAGLYRLGVPFGSWPESLHWNWRGKAPVAWGIPGMPPDGHRLFGIERDGQRQGLLMAERSLHRSRLADPTAGLVYIKYLETAPWN